MKQIANFFAAHNYAESTVITYRHILAIFLQENDPQTLDAADLVAFVKSKGWGNSRQQVALFACKKYIVWRYGATHPALSARIKRETGKPQRALDAKTALELLASFDRFSPKGARDLALCSLALDSGLRESELCRIEIPYVDLEHCTLQVLVKGGQWEAAVFTPETAAHIQHWMAYRLPISGLGYLFTSTRDGRKLHPHVLYAIVANWGKKIGIKLSPHDLRRSFATLATEMGAPERIIMEGGRWKHSDMIKRYTRTLRLDAMRAYLPTKGLTRT